MMILLPLAVALAGALLYGLTTGKASELGRLMFAVGLLAFLLRSSTHLLEFR